MTDPRIPTGPLDREPDPLFVPVEERRRLLDQVLAGVELGAWDQRIIAWLAGFTDTSTVSTVVSLVERARAAAAAAATPGPWPEHGPVADLALRRLLEHLHHLLGLEGEARERTRARIAALLQEGVRPE